jgi:hypothetical protein
MRYLNGNGFSTHCVDQNYKQKDRQTEKKRINGISTISF